LSFASVDEGSRLDFASLRSASSKRSSESSASIFRAASWIFGSGIFVSWHDFSYLRTRLAVSISVATRVQANTISFARFRAGRALIWVQRYSICDANWYGKTPPSANIFTHRKTNKWSATAFSKLSKSTIFLSKPRSWKSPKLYPGYGPPIIASINMAGFIISNMRRRRAAPR